MNRKELAAKIDANNQVLIIKGSPLGRTLSLHGEEIDLSSSQKFVRFSEAGFNWGYMGNGTRQAAFAILLEVIDDPELAMKYTEEFAAAIVQFLPNETFTVYVDILDFLHFVDGTDKDRYTKKVSGFKFMKVDYAGKKIPKSLDMINLPFANFHYEKHTWEGEWLGDLDPMEFAIFLNYLKVNSDRYSHLTLNNRICIDFKRDEDGGFMFFNGLGTGDYKGHPNLLFEKTT